MVLVDGAVCSHGIGKLDGDERQGLRGLAEDAVLVEGVLQGEVGGVAQDHGDFLGGRG